MDAKIKPDWLSWTFFPMVKKGDPMNDLYRADAFNKQYARFGLYAETKSISASRKPYTRRHNLLAEMGVLYFNPKLDYCTAELTGRGCTKIMTDDIFEMVAEQALDTVSRFDVAIDFQTDVMPDEFVMAGISDRIKSRSMVQSATGQTAYIGSPTSDMMARVYKYEPPHERAGLLRIEFVARRKRAKIALKLWLEQGPIMAIAFMAKAFEF